MCNLAHYFDSIRYLFYTMFCIDSGVMQNALIRKKKGHRGGIWQFTYLDDPLQRLGIDTPFRCRCKGIIYSWQEIFMASAGKMSSMLRQSVMGARICYP